MAKTYAFGGAGGAYLGSAGAYGLVGAAQDYVAVYDPDAQDYFDRVAAAGGTLTTGQMSAVSGFVTNLKDADLWDKLTGFGPFLGGTLAAYLVRLKYTASLGGTSSYTNVGLTSAAVTALGLKGDGTGYLNTNVNIPSLVKDNTVVGYYKTAGGTLSGFRCCKGSSYSASGNLDRFYFGDDSANNQFGFGAIGINGALPSTGVQGGGSYTSGGTTVVNSYSSATSPTTSTPGSQTWQKPGTVLVLRGGTASATNCTLGCDFELQNMSPAQWNTFAGLVQTCMTALGRNV